MMQLTFFATDHELEMNTLNMDDVVNHPVVHSIAINDPNEWALLQQVFSLQVIATSQQNVDFKTVMKLQKAASSYQPSFDQLYQQWLELTQRENSMDEYGQLLFLGESSFLGAKYIHVIEE